MSPARLTLFLAFLLFLAVAPSSSAEDRSPRPRLPDDYGTMYGQTAHVFAVRPSDYLLINPAAVADTLRPLAAIPADQYFNILAQLPLVYLTHLQLEWEGILMEVHRQPVGQVDVNHPPHYIRGSVVHVQAINGDTGQPISLGMVDEKGSGLSPEGEEAFRLYHSALQFVLGRTRWTAETPQTAEWLGARERLEAHLPRLRAARVQLRAARPEAGLARRNHDKSLHELELKLTLTQYLLLGMRQLESTGEARPETRNRVLEAIRGMDYENGLLPLDRAVKEFLMGLAWERFFNRYNARHGTNYQVIRPLAVAALPVDILLPNGQRRRAGVLLREPHWRNLDNEQLGRMFPERMIDPVIGGLQTALYGELVDLELPALQLAPASELLGWRDLAGHAIDAASARVTQALLDGDRQPLEQLVERVLRLVDETPIPDEPFPVTGRLSEGTLAVRHWIRELHGKTRTLTEPEKGEIRRLLGRDSGASISEKKTLLNVLILSNRAVGVEVLIERLQDIGARVESTARRRSAQGTNVSFEVGDVADSLMTVLLHSDPTYRLRTGEEQRLFDVLFALPQGLYLGLVRTMARRVYVATAHSLGLADAMSDATSLIWRGAEDAILAILALHEADRVAPAGATSFNVAFTFIGRTGPAASEAFLRFMELNRRDRGMFNLILFTAERFIGRHLSDRLLRYLDPNGEGGAMEMRTSLRRHQEHIRGLVVRLEAMGMSYECALNRVVQALEAGEHWALAPEAP